MKTRWATSTDRASFNDDDVTRLLMVIHEKIEEGSELDEPGQEHRAIWENIGAQVEALRFYHVCCACLALVHEEDREGHPCGPCTCAQPVVKEDVPNHEGSCEALYSTDADCSCKDEPMPKLSRWKAQTRSCR